MFGFLIFHDIGTFCYSKVLVEAGQIGEFAAKKGDKSARLKKIVAVMFYYKVIKAYNGFQKERNL